MLQNPKVKVLRKPNRYRYEMVVHAKSAEPSCNPCIYLKISQVFTYKRLSITLLNYLKNKVWRTKPMPKIAKENKPKQKSKQFFK